jgi:putative phage-type endonuclease
MPKIDLVQGSPEWHAFRKNGVGASEVAAVLGESPYCSRETLLARKLGCEDEQRTTEYMANGIAREDFLRQAMEVKLDTPLFPAVYQHDTCPRLFASLDGLSADGTQIVEIKTCSWSTLENARMNVIPRHHEYQIQAQLMCCPSAIHVVVAYQHCRGIKNLVLVTRKPDAVMQTEILREVKKFWNLVLEMPITPITEKLSDDIPQNLLALLRQLDDIEPNYRHYKAQYDTLIEAIRESADNKNYSTDLYDIVPTKRTTISYKDACIDYGIDVTAYIKDTVTVSVRRKKNV